MATNSVRTTTQVRIQPLTPVSHGVVLAFTKLAIMFVVIAGSLFFLWRAFAEQSAVGITTMMLAVGGAILGLFFLYSDWQAARRK